MKPWFLDRCCYCGNRVGLSPWVRKRDKKSVCRDCAYDKIEDAKHKIEDAKRCGT